MSDCKWCDAGLQIVHNGGPRHLTINDGFVKWWDECKNYGRPNTAYTGLGLSAAKSADTEPEVLPVAATGSQPSR